MTPVRRAGRAPSIMGVGACDAAADQIRRPLLAATPAPTSSKHTAPSRGGGNRNTPPRRPPHTYTHHAALTTSVLGPAPAGTRLVHLLPVALRGPDRPACSSRACCCSCQQRRGNSSDGMECTYTCTVESISLLLEGLLLLLPAKKGNQLRLTGPNT